MDFQRELYKRQTLNFYRQMAAAYLLAAEQIEKGEAHSLSLEYAHQFYALDTLKEFSFQSLCQEHVWSCDESNYRCLNCKEWRSLEPIKVELPEELLLIILSFLGRNTLLKVCSKIRMHTIYQNCYQIVQRFNPRLQLKNQFCCDDDPAFVIAYVECEEVGDHLLTYSYADEKSLTINRNTTVGMVKKQVCANRIYSITAFMIATWNRCNQFFRNRVSRNPPREDCLQSNSKRKS